MFSTNKDAAATAGFQARKPIDLCEAAMHLLQTASPGFYVRYGIGVVPFILALLFFWSDMSRSAFASQHLFSASVAMSAAFLWMKVWQALACYQLRCRLYAATPDRWTWRDLVGLVLRQTTWQPTGFLILPVAMLVTLPFAACYAFYQNLTVLEAPKSHAVEAALSKRAASYGRLWPWQGFKLFGLFMVLGLVVFLNILTLFIFLPGLAKSLLGLDNPFARNFLLVFNSTVLMSTVVGAYFVVDLLGKACCLLRCYDAESLGNGQDLHTAWSRIQRRRAMAAAGLAIVAFVSLSVLAPQASAQDGKAPEQTTAFDEAADHVLTDRRYVWRQPRERSTEIKAVKLPDWAAAVRDRVQDFIDWLLGRKRDDVRGGTMPLSLSAGLTRLALYLLVFVLVGVAIYQFLKKKGSSEVGEMEVAKALEEKEPDLNDENIAADDLPSSEWTRLGAQLLAEGNYRLALRAYHLAMLAHLADKRLILYARYKSNRDYMREVQRRAHAYPGIEAPFKQSVGLFEQTWYGNHAAGESDVEALKAHFQRIHEGIRPPSLPNVSA